MVNQLVQSTFFIRLLENIVPALSWIIISLPFWLSPSHPALASYFIISFDLYFFYKALSTAYFTTLSYRKIHENETVDFAKKIAKNKKAAGIHHVIIIPNYKEPLYKIEETIISITNTTYPFKNMYLVLACEKREEDAEEKARKLQEKFSGFFKDILVSYHVLLPHEVPGKASNQTYAAKIVDAYFEEKQISRKDVLITICDADSRLSKNYFPYLTCKYLQDAGRQYHFYWAPVLLYNNFWQLPLFVRMQATLSSILRLSFLSQKENLIQVSTYSTNLWLLKSVNFWDVDIIPEDWHVYFQAFFTHGEKVKTIPLYTITNGDAVYSGGLMKTLINRYEQEKRWAWGVSDVGYALKKFLTTPHIKTGIKLKKLLFLVETHLFWPTSFFILTLSASIPPLVNPAFKRTVLGFLLPQLSGIILTLASTMLLLYIYLDIQLRKKVNIKTRLQSLPLLFVQWYFLPLVSLLLSSLPALDAHTRLLFGKKITYKVTEKV